MHRKIYKFLNKHINWIIFVLFFLFVTFIFLLAILNDIAIWVISLIFSFFLFCGYKAAQFKRANDKIFEEKSNENNGNVGSRKAS